MISITYGIENMGEWDFVLLTKTRTVIFVVRRTAGQGVPRTVFIQTSTDKLIRNSWTDLAEICGRSFFRITRRALAEIRERPLFRAPRTAYTSDFNVWPFQKWPDG